MERLVVRSRKVAELRYYEAKRSLTIVYHSGKSRPLGGIDRNMVLKLISQLARKNAAFMACLSELAIII